MTPPKAFLIGLRTYDLELDLRWGTHVQQWVVERKSDLIGPGEIQLLRGRSRRLAGMPEVAQVNEELQSALAGRRIILFATILDNRILDLLRLSDIQRFGGYARFADQLEADEEREAQLRESVARKDRELAAYAAHDVLDFILRKRSAKLDSTPNAPLSEIIGVPNAHFDPFANRRLHSGARTGRSRRVG